MVSSDFINPNLFNSEVELVFKPGSVAITKFGRSLTGVLAGRIIKELFDRERPSSEIIAVIVKTFDQVHTIPVNEIENIDRATFLA
jgi:hypothetical protein